MSTIKWEFGGEVAGVSGPETERVVKGGGKRSIGRAGAAYMRFNQGVHGKRTLKRGAVEVRASKSGKQ